MDHDWITRRNVFSDSSTWDHILDPQHGDIFQRLSSFQYPQRDLKFLEYLDSDEREEYERGDRQGALRKKYKVKVFACAFEALLARLKMLPQLMSGYAILVQPSQVLDANRNVLIATAQAVGATIYPWSPECQFARGSPIYLWPDSVPGPFTQNGACVGLKTLTTDRFAHTVASIFRYWWSVQHPKAERRAANKLGPGAVATLREERWDQEESRRLAKLRRMEVRAEKLNPEQRIRLQERSKRIVAKHRNRAVQRAKEDRGNEGERGKAELGRLTRKFGELDL